MKWKTSSFTQSEQCVEVNQILTSIRDSKNRNGGNIKVNVPALVEFVKR